MKVTRILHTSVNTAGAADETAGFYRDVLGLAPSSFRPDIPGVPGHWFEARNAQVHLVGRAPSDQRESTRRVTTSALESLTSTRPSPSSKPAASSSYGACSTIRDATSRRSSSPTRAATRSSSNTTPEP